MRLFPMIKGPQYHVGCGGKVEPLKFFDGKYGCEKCKTIISETEVKEQEECKA